MCILLTLRHKTSGNCKYPAGIAQGVGLGGLSPPTFSDGKIIPFFFYFGYLVCVAGVKRGRGRGNLSARGRKERNLPLRLLVTQ